MDADFLLIHKMKNGDEEAIEVFVKKYYSTIRNYCRLHTYTDCDAEDITQATFEHFFRSFRSYPVYIQTVRGVGYRFNGNLGSE